MASIYATKLESLLNEACLASFQKAKPSCEIMAWSLRYLTLSLGLVESLDSGGGVHVHLSSHDETILEELSDVLSCKEY